MAVELVPDPPAEEEAEPQQTAPSVLSVVNRYVVGGAEVSLPAEDGSRVVRFHSLNGGTIIEANLAQELCDFVSTGLVRVEVIEEGGEDAGDAED